MNVPSKDWSWLGRAAESSNLRLGVCVNVNYHMNLNDEDGCLKETGATDRRNITHVWLLLERSYLAVSYH